MEWFQRFLTFYQGIISPALDVVILAFLVYKLYELLLKTQTVQMIRGAFFLAIVYGVAFFLKLNTLQWILQALAPSLLIVVAIIFQPELRKLMLRLGQTELFQPDRKPQLPHLEAVVAAAVRLSEERRGMLVVFPRKVSLRDIAETGTKLNADISSALIIAVFEFDGPLHDGAMLIQYGRIAAAGCFLPLSEQQNIKKSFGTRHRASLGMSEQSDAVVLVVSEETGAISLAFDGKLYYDLTPVEITQKLMELIERGSFMETEKPPAKRIGSGMSVV
ncbi:MAG: diadenylate cyclase CdaA [Treponema sp.]|jgi:diadenylate cyclase|nr:diadenylate cyclase CdaA [Treponema sp.]